MANHGYSSRELKKLHKNKNGLFSLTRFDYDYNKIYNFLKLIGETNFKKRKNFTNKQKIILRKKFTKHEKNINYDFIKGDAQSVADLEQVGFIGATNNGTFINALSNNKEAKSRLLKFGIIKQTFKKRHDYIINFDDQQREIFLKNPRISFQILFGYHNTDTAHDDYYEAYFQLNYFRQSVIKKFFTLDGIDLENYVQFTFQRGLRGQKRSYDNIETLENYVDEDITSEAKENITGIRIISFK